MGSLCKQPLISIVGIWLFLTAINISKPFHSDDAFHLEAADHIIKEPIRPMSGLIRWETHNPTPIRLSNQPPLLFYMIAGVALVFGFNEIALHLLISIFSFLALNWFFKAATLLEVKKPIALLALLGFCPAFVVNQNVHTDVPVMSLIIGTLYYLLLSDKREKWSYRLISILLCTIAIFIKYSALPIIFAIGLIFALRKQYRSLLFLLIPLGLIILWSLWNYWEFGGIHILERKAGSKSSISDRAWTFVTNLGSVAPFGVILLNYLLKKIISVFIVCVSTALLLLAAAFFYFSSVLDNERITQVLEILFFINGGIIILGSILITFRNYQKSDSSQLFIQSNNAIVIVFLLASTAFLIGFAPFMGTRHILLTIPFFLLLSGLALMVCSSHLVKYSIIASLLLSLLLGISDWKYAYYYKNSASGIMKGMPPNSTVWASGSNGWQWYAKKNGMRQYLREFSNPKPGDYLVIPSRITFAKIYSDNPFVVVAQIWGEASPLTYFSVSDNYSMYLSTKGKPSWTLSKRAMDTIYVCQYPISE